ncbi:MAG: hypothetical protein EOO39_02165 [Cytophagaceae bacterium]|nr:MAG: hypothetical protein EOO39_02165 [Cytophagaceae bacterium]
MQRKQLVLLGALLSMTLFLVAAWYYPGGSQVDSHSVGYDWKANYISNLFGERALNGSANAARSWALGGMVFLAISFALFFIDFSRKIPAKGAANVIRYVGVTGMLFTILIATPLHDLMITIASTLFLVSFFYITVFIVKSRLHLLKFLCVICLLIFYTTLYLYGSGDYRSYLPIMQKITFVSTIGLVLGLTYFTEKEDFS